MNRFAYYMSGYAFKAFSGISKARITIHGEEKIPRGQGAIIFTANHFTRIETVFLPYHIHEITKRPVWSLAAAELFQGGLKGILEAMGAVSTRDPQRDFLIVKSLLTGQAECIIFPEGMMVKNKKITSDGDFRLHRDENVLQRPHTGAATLALQTEFYRERLRRMKTINIKEFNRLITLYDIKSPDEVLKQQTCIVPVNITYYPVRARENVLSKIALNMMENPSERVMDELLTEGTMIFSGVDVDIRFGDPVCIKDYFFDSFIESDVTSRRKIDFSNRLSSHHVMRASAQHIMNRYMASVYDMTTLNYDHIFASILKYMPDTGKGIDEYDFRCRAFLATFACEMSLHCNFHKSLYENQVHILTNDRFHRYEDFIKLAVETGVVEQKGGRIYKNDSKFNAGYEFHTARIENPISVIANEVEPLAKLQAYFSDLAIKSPSEIALLMSYKIEDAQYNRYLNDFEEYIGNVSLPEPLHETLGIAYSYHAEDEVSVVDSSNEAEAEDFFEADEHDYIPFDNAHSLAGTTKNESLISTAILKDFHIKHTRESDMVKASYGVEVFDAKKSSDIKKVSGMKSASGMEILSDMTLRQDTSTDETVKEDQVLSVRHRQFIKQYLASESRVEIYNNGRPQLLKSDYGDSGILLIHDYLSCPGELLPFARYLQSKGFTVYLPRLPGHGTAPENMTEVVFVQWIEAVEEGLVLLRSLCRKKIVGGVGLGGMLSVALQSRVTDMDALFMVAPPQKIKDYPNEFFTSRGLWGQMMKRAGLPSGEKDDWITYLPEMPEFRYSTHPVSSIKQVDMLLEQIEAQVKDGEKKKDKLIGKNRVKDINRAIKQEISEGQNVSESFRSGIVGNLRDRQEDINYGVDIPILIVQSRNNPFINSRGAQKMFDLISAPMKEYYLFDFNRHVMLRGRGKERIYSAISGFIEAVLTISS
ncbi:MAG: 1-acyl-sn-glycerol-3-phosphate acyltransferase [Desulfamplus sp.]|nr:1-acyl-sn-glycerol-3-phosphate acyltransferase [Desulfamplus sp.]